MSAEQHTILGGCSRRLQEAGITRQIVMVFGTWLALNLALNYYNKFVLSKTDFHYPFLLTAGNKVVGFLVAVAVMYFDKGLPMPTELSEQFLRPIVHLQGVATALNIGLNNYSLMLITLTLNQVLKATAPLPTALLSTVLEHKSYSWQLYGSMVVLISGCALAAWGDLGEESLLGILAACGSILASGLWTVLSAVLMQSGVKPLDAVSLLFVSGPTCILTLLIFFFAVDLPRLMNAEPGEHRIEAWKLMLYIGIAALLAAVYDIVHNQFVKLTSSMNMAIMGNTKLALLIALSMATLEKPPTLLRLVGVVVAFVGTVWYSVFKLHEQQTKRAAAVGEQTRSDLPPKLPGTGVGASMDGAAASVARATEKTHLLNGCLTEERPTSSSA